MDLVDFPRIGGLFMDFSRIWWIFRLFFRFFVDFSWIGWIFRGLLRGFGGFFAYFVDSRGFFVDLSVDFSRILWIFP